MRKGISGLGSRTLALTLLGALGLLALGCGGGPDAGNTKDFYVKRFSVPNFSGILLDESVSWVFSHPVDPSTLNHDSIRIRTGAQAGNAPRGTFVRGIFLIDPVTGTRVVVDPDQVSANALQIAQNNGTVTPIPDSARYDLGADSPYEGRRQVLFDYSYRDVVTFVPDVPSRPDLSDTGYQPGATYTVVLPAYPSLNVVRSIDDYPLLPRDGRVFVSTFTTVPSTAAQLFLGGENEGNPRVVNTEPKNGFRVNVVQGDPDLTNGQLTESPVSVTSNRQITATFEIEGADQLEQPVLATVAFNNESGVKTTGETFARVSEVRLISGIIPDAYVDSVNPNNSLPRGVVEFRRVTQGLLFLTATGPLSGPATFPLGYNVQIEDPNLTPPTHITDLNPGWATPVLEPLLDSNNDPILDPNGNQVMTVAGVDMRISIRFSQPLDPRTITTDNFFLEIASVAGRPQIPVSLFLRQTRLGVIEVVLTPLTDKGLAAGQFYEVTVSSGVRDLLGSPLNSIVTSFEITAGGVPPTVTDIVESFESNSKENTGLTTANWNGSKPFVGAEPGALTAVFAPFAGNGSEGAYAPEGGEIRTLSTGTSAQTVHNYTSVDIGFGVAVLASGTYGLVMRSQGNVRIAGLLDVSGSNGGTGTTGDINNPTPTGGNGGSGGPGGYAGGDGAMSATGNFDGLDGFGPASVGGGQGGLSGDQEAGTSSTDPLRMRVAGGGGGHATAGTDSDFANWKGQNSGRGGPAYGEADFSDAPLVPAVVGVPTLEAGFGGAGGGGGGGEDDGTQDLNGDGTIDANGTVGGEDEGGGGGGGGGGSLQIVTYTDVSIIGRIDANGGDGGSTTNPSTGSLGQGAAGGGGAGGAVWVLAYGNISLDAQAQVEALGGKGGQGDSNGVTVQKGGNGGDGYIRFEDKDGKVTISDGSSSLPSTVTPTTGNSVATFIPALALDSVAQSEFYNQFIPTPNYGTPQVDMDVNDGSIDIYVQGAREDLTQPGPQPVDPDTDPLRLSTTDWVPIAQVDQLDNYQYLRFRVEFSVDPLHDFADPLPIVREIRIPVSTVPD